MRIDLSKYDATRRGDAPQTLDRIGPAFLPRGAVGGISGSAFLARASIFGLGIKGSPTRPRVGGLRMPSIRSTLCDLCAGCPSLPSFGIVLSGGDERPTVTPSFQEIISGAYKRLGLPRSEPFEVSGCSRKRFSSVAASAIGIQTSHGDFQHGKV